MLQSDGLAIGSRRSASYRPMVLGAARTGLDHQSC
jgi:hypothetical protein